MLERAPRRFGRSHAACYSPTKQLATQFTYWEHAVHQGCSFAPALPNFHVRLSTAGQEVAQEREPDCVAQLGTLLSAKKLVRLMSRISVFS